MAQATVEHPAEIVDARRPGHRASRGAASGGRSSPCRRTDGTGEIDAWIMRPAGFEARRKYPVLLNVHGGPFTQYGETFFDEAQMQAAAGFVVVMSQPARRQRPRHGVGPGDHRAQAPDASRAPAGAASTSTTCSPCSTPPSTATRSATRDRVGMLGGSYGGYMATLLAGPPRRPLPGHLLRAGRQQHALGGVVAATSAPRSASTHGPDHLEDPDEYARMSPIR